jgi:chorismate mutase
VFVHRNFGARDGEPRRGIDPWVQVHDYRHAITYATTLVQVDAAKVGVWGASYSGGHAVVVAAMDRRVRAVSVQAPMLRGLANLRSLARADHVAQLPRTVRRRPARPVSRRRDGRFVIVRRGSLGGVSLGRWLLAGSMLVATVVIGGCSGQSPTSSAPGSSQQPSASTQPGNPSDPFSGLAALAVQRIMTADQVAAAKFGTPQPIDDPPREQQELDSVAAASPGMGINSAESVQFFRDQIEASKVVQRGLYQLWTVHPKQRPTVRPDLSKQVRPELDRLTTDILRQLQATTAARHAGGQCAVQASQALAEAAQPLDQLHRDALAVALRSVCSQS